MGAVPRLTDAEIDDIARRTVESDMNVTIPKPDASSQPPPDASTGTTEVKPDATKEAAEKPWWSGFDEKELEFTADKEARKVTLKDLREKYGPAGFDYTQKAQKLAEERKAWEAERDKQVGEHFKNRDQFWHEFLERDPVAAREWLKENHPRLFAEVTETKPVTEATPPQGPPLGLSQESWDSLSPEEQSRITAEQKKITELEAIKEKAAKALTVEDYKKLREAETETERSQTAADVRFRAEMEEATEKHKEIMQDPETFDIVRRLVREGTDRRDATGYNPVTVVEAAELVSKLVAKQREAAEAETIDKLKVKAPVQTGPGAAPTPETPGGPKTLQEMQDAIDGGWLPT